MILSKKDLSKNVLLVKHTPTHFISSKNRPKSDKSTQVPHSKILQLMDTPPDSLGIGINQ